MSEDKYIVYKIKNENKIYIHKDELYSYGLKYDSKEQVYKNKYALSSIEEKNITEFCDRYDYSLSKSEEIIKDEKDKYKKRFKLISHNKNIYSILNRSSQIFPYTITTNSEASLVRFNIVDNTKGELISIVREPTNDNRLFFLMQVLSIEFEKIQAINEKINLKEVFDMLSSLLDIYSSSVEEQMKVKRFRLAKINELLKKQENQGKQKIFLINAVRGYYWETDFFLHVPTKKIYSSHSDNIIDYDQEMKVWNFIYDNKSFICKRRRPSMEERYIGKRIKVTTSDGFTSSVPIVKIKYIDSLDKYALTIYNGKKNQEIPKVFSKEAIEDMVKSNR